MIEYLTLVDENDQVCGKEEKLLVHQKGLLHRAFSVFIFNSKGQLLLQQRASIKYHSPNLWTNTCCSHPQYNEMLTDAINRRMKEEMDLEIETQFMFSFLYKAQFSNGLTEHELDHVYFGTSDLLPNPNEEEVQDWKYLTLEELQDDMLQRPENYTAWLNICLPKVMEHFTSFQHSLIVNATK